MNKKEVIEKTKEYVRKKLEGESSGHDWWHTWRVWRMAKKIAKEEKADIFVVELAALLHDVADHKLHKGSETAGLKLVIRWLEKLEINQEIIKRICEILVGMSFRKTIGKKTELKTLEGKIVQDADRLDALGAIGVARTFAFGGCNGRELYNPGIKPLKYKNVEEYKKSRNPSLNHFYEKLFKLKNMMNTKTAKKIARGRHKFMEDYIKIFFDEWEGKK